MFVRNIIANLGGLELIFPRPELEMMEGGSGKATSRWYQPGVAGTPTGKCLSLLVTNNNSSCHQLDSATESYE